MGGRLLNFPISRVGAYSRMGAKSNKYSSHIYFNEERKERREKHKKIKQKKTKKKKKRKTHTHTHKKKKKKKKKTTSCGILRENIKLDDKFRSYIFINFLF